MKHFLSAAVIVLAISGVVQAQDYEKGMQAYDVGEYATALQELRPLAKQGHYLAQGQMGFMYLFGKGLPRDHVLAYMWFNLSSANASLAGAEYDLAAKSRDTIAKLMTREDISIAQAMTRECIGSRYQNCGY